MSKLFKSDLQTDPTDFIANKGFWIDIFHVNSGQSVKFKAMLENFSDTFNSSYDEQYFVMQTQPIRKWTNTSREISVEWKAVAAGISEAKQNMARVSMLTNMLYAEQEKTKDGVMITKAGGSPLFKVRLQNLIGAPGMDFGPAETAGQMGYIANFLYKFDMESPFLHAPSLRDNAQNAGRAVRRSEQGQENMVYPQAINLSFTFYPVYEKSPSWIRDESGEIQFNINSLAGDKTKFPYGVETTTTRGNISLPLKTQAQRDGAEAAAKKVLG